MSKPRLMQLPSHSKSSEKSHFFPMSGESFSIRQKKDFSSLQDGSHLQSLLHGFSSHTCSKSATSWLDIKTAKIEKIRIFKRSKVRNEEGQNSEAAAERFSRVSSTADNAAKSSKTFSENKSIQQVLLNTPNMAFSSKLQINQFPISFFISKR